MGLFIGDNDTKIITLSVDGGNFETTEGYIHIAEYIKNKDEDNAVVHTRLYKSKADKDAGKPIINVSKIKRGWILPCTMEEFSANNAPAVLYAKLKTVIEALDETWADKIIDDI